MGGLLMFDDFDVYGKGLSEFWHNQMHDILSETFEGYLGYKSNLQLFETVVPYIYFEFPDDMENFSIDRTDDDYFEYHVKIGEADKIESIIYLIIQRIKAEAERGYYV